MSTFLETETMSRWGLSDESIAPEVPAAFEDELDEDEWDEDDWDEDEWEEGDEDEEDEWEEWEEDDDDELFGRRRRHRWDEWD